MPVQPRQIDTSLRGNKAYAPENTAEMVHRKSDIVVGKVYFSSHRDFLPLDATKADPSSSDILWNRHVRIHYPITVLATDGRARQIEVQHPIDFAGHTTTRWTNWQEVWSVWLPRDQVAWGEAKAKLKIRHKHDLAAKKAVDAMTKKLEGVGISDSSAKLDWPYHWEDRKRVYDTPVVKSVEISKREIDLLVRRVRRLQSQLAAAKANHEIQF